MFYRVPEGMERLDLMREDGNDYRESYSTELAAAFDISSCSDLVIQPEETATISTGLYVKTAYYSVASIREDFTPYPPCFLNTLIAISPSSCQEFDGVDGVPPLIRVPYLDIRPRSGLARRGIMVVNSPGLVDADFFPSYESQNEIGVLLRNTTSQPFTVAYGDRIAQGMYLTTLRRICGKPRVGGFGSTGKC